MTIDTSSTYEFSIDQIVREGYRLASVLGPDATLSQTQLSAGKDALERIAKGSATYGLFARKVDFYNLPLATGIFQYTLPANVFDCVGDGMYIDPSEADITQASSETVVKLVSREKWHMTSSKSASTRPSMYYPHRAGAQVVAYLWPVPSSTENGGHIRFQTHQLRANSTDGGKTPDFERFWEDFLAHRLAHDIALMNALTIERAKYLRILYTEKRDECRALAKEQMNQQAVLDHPTGWSR